jgi:hypothetical protein
MNIPYRTFVKSEAERVEHDDDAFEMPSMEERLRRSRANMRMVAEVDEIFTRTLRLVDRLCPPVGVPTISTRYPELNGSSERWALFQAARERRNELHRIIKPRIAAKVQNRHVRDGRGSW